MNDSSDKAKIGLHYSKDKVSIIISADAQQSEADSWSIQAQKALSILFQKANLNKEVFYVDDIFEILDNYPDFLGRVNSLIIDGKTEELKKKITDFNFDLPEGAFEQEIKRIWEKETEKRGFYLMKIFSISGDDKDFKRDLHSKNKIEEYLPSEVKLHKLSPSEWEKQKDTI